eukprot:GHVU01042190.1.p1 GENE.GHVU01042190.1~~GHVU01042190.1.p1  ORF type:complete len:133 (-),score=12.60 GHVU01042190.1:372-770(-)
MENPSRHAPIHDCHEQIDRMYKEPDRGRNSPIPTDEEILFVLENGSLRQEILMCLRFERRKMSGAWTARALWCSVLLLLHDEADALHIMRSIWNNKVGLKIELAFRLGVQSEGWMNDVYYSERVYDSTGGSY